MITLQLLIRIQKSETRKIKYNSHWNLGFAKPVVFFVSIWEHDQVYRTQSCSKCVNKGKRENILSHIKLRQNVSKIKINN